MATHSVCLQDAVTTDALLYRLETAARMLGTSKRNLYRIIDDGGLRVIRIGRRGVRIHRAELERFALSGMGK